MKQRIDADEGVVVDEGIDANEGADVYERRQVYEPHFCLFALSNHQTYPIVRFLLFWLQVVLEAVIQSYGS